MRTSCITHHAYNTSLWYQFEVAVLLWKLCLAADREHQCLAGGFGVQGYSDDESEDSPPCVISKVMLSPDMCIHYLSVGFSQTCFQCFAPPLPLLGISWSPSLHSTSPGIMQINAPLCASFGSGILMQTSEAAVIFPSRSFLSRNN